MQLRLLFALLLMTFMGIGCPTANDDDATGDDDDATGDDDDATGDDDDATGDDDDAAGDDDDATGDDDDSAGDDDDSAGDDDDSTGFRLVRCLCGEACARRLVGLWSGQSARKPLLSPAVRSTNGCGSDDEAWSLSDASRRPRGSGLHRRSGNGSSPTHENTREMESAPNPEEEFV